MKPAWDKLMKEFDGSKTALVGDVDCTADGKGTCEKVGVQGYPTIKWGDPSALEDYQGGRDFDALKKFADENLKPMCSPSNLDLCDAEKKAEIETLMALSEDDLKTKVTEGEDKIKAAEDSFKKKVEKLQKKYEQLSKEKDEAIADVKKSGLGLTKAVLAAKGKKKEEL